MSLPIAFKKTILLRLAGYVLLFALAMIVLLTRGQQGFADEPPALVFRSEVLDPPSLAATEDSLRVTDIGNIRLIISNTGTFGTRFDQRDVASMEWPARSGIDHLVRGALWVGGISAANGDTLVTSAGRDAYYLDPITLHSEFTPLEGPREYSRLRTSPFFRPGTVSDENLHAVFVDTIPKPKEGGSGQEAHTPMGLRVIQETYGWGFDPLDDFVIVEFNVINVGDISMQDVWVGFSSELVTNNRNFFGNWPPGGVWFDFQLPEWNAEQRLLTNHNARGGRVGATEYAGVKILGSGGSGPFGRGPDSISTKQISLSSWSWSPSQFLVWPDDSLYVQMSTGEIRLEELVDPDNTEINPVTVVSVGPFPLLAPGDTVQVVMALMAGSDEADLLKNAFWAQKAYDDKYALPSPPSSPILRVYPRHREVVFRWSEDPESEPDPATKLLDFQGYRVYLSSSPLSRDYRLVHQYDVKDGVGFDSGLDAVRLEEPFIDEKGDSLWYELRLQGIPDGFKRYAAVTSYDFQTGDPPTLEGGVLQNSIYFITGPDREEARENRNKVSVFPNPYRGESAFDVRNPDGSVNPRRRVLWFVNLPQQAHIKIYTLAGDIVREYDFDSETYGGLETAGISPDRADLAVGRRLVTSGSMAGFDLLNEDGQEISSGLYLFSVEDKSTGEHQQGKFMIIR